MKTKIWSALSVYVLVAIVKKRLAPDVSLYKLLQILSITLFEKMPISTALFDVASKLMLSKTLTSCHYSTYDRTL